VLLIGIYTLGGRVDDRFYREMPYIIDRPKWDKVGEEFWWCINFMKIMDRLGVMKVNPLFLNRQHNNVLISIDNVVYDEDVWTWIKRFGKRAEEQ
jgi:hypothetical protein